MCVISTYRRNFELLIHLQSRVESVRSLRRRHFWYLLDGGLARKAVGQWLCGLSWGGSTCKGAVVWRSPCWDLSWLPGFNADESSRSSEVRRRAGGEWHELPRFWGENKYLASLRGVGHVAQEFDCPSVRYLGISIHYFERKKKSHWILVVLDMGFGVLDAFISRAPLNLVWIQWSTTWENMTSEKIRFLWPSVLQAGLVFLLLGKLFSLNIEWFVTLNCPFSTLKNWCRESESLFRVSRCLWQIGLWFLDKVNIYLQV